MPLLRRRWRYFRLYREAAQYRARGIVESSGGLGRGGSAAAGRGPAKKGKAREQAGEDISFFEKRRSIERGESLKVLAGWAGVDLPQLDEARPKKEKRESKQEKIFLFW